MSDDEDEDDELDEDNEDDEDEDDEDYDDEGAGDDTEAVLIAGRAIETSEMTRSGFDKFATHVERVAGKHGVTLSIVGAGDLTETGPSPDDTICATVIVGHLIASGGSFEPDGVSREKALSALAEVGRIPDTVWSAVGEALSGVEKERFAEAKTALHLTCSGPLAAGTLAFGVVGEQEDGGPGEYHHGQDSNQEPHTTGVWGVSVGYCQYESPDSVEVDLGDSAHEERAAAVGKPDARYYLISRYD